MRLARTGCKFCATLKTWEGFNEAQKKSIKAAQILIGIDFLRMFTRHAAKEAAGDASGIGELFEIAKTTMRFVDSLKQAERQIINECAAEFGYGSTQCDCPECKQ